MNYEKSELTRMLQARETGEPTAFCPEDQDLAAWFDGPSVRSPDSMKIRQHLAQCGYCRSRLGMLERLSTESQDAHLPQELVARAKQLAPEPASPRRRAVPAWSAAAVIILALGLVFVNDWKNQGTSPEGLLPAESRQLRSLETTSPRPEVLQPAPQQVLNAETLQVSWTPVQDSVHYELLILDAAGKRLHSERVDGTAWESDGSLSLQAGARYYLRVNAHLADGRSEGSRHTPFVVAAKDSGNN